MMAEEEDNGVNQLHYNNNRQRKFSILNIFASNNSAQNGSQVQRKPSSSNLPVTIPGVIKQGFLVKQGQNYKNLKKRYFILLDDCLLYFKDSTDIFHPLGVIYLHEAFVDDEPFDEKKNYFSFVVRSFSKRFLLNCASEEEKQKWVQSIQKVIQSHANLRRVSSSSSIEESFGKHSKPEPTPSHQVPNLHMPSSSFDPSTLLEKIQKEQDKVLKIISSISLLDKPMENLKEFTQKQKQFLKQFEKKHSVTLNEEEEEGNESGEESGDEFAAVKRIGASSTSIPQFTRKLSSPHFLDPIEKLNSHQNYLTEMLEDLETIFTKVTNHLESNQQIVSKFSTNQGLSSIIRELKQNQQALKKAVIHQLQSFETEFSTFNKTMNIQESFRITETAIANQEDSVFNTPTQISLPIAPALLIHSNNQDIRQIDNRKSIDVASSTALLEFQKILKENETLKLERERMDTEIKELKRVKKLLVKELKQFRSEAS